MLATLIKRSFFNQKRSMAVMVVAVAAGTAVTASLLTLSFDIAAKVSKELRSYGANIIIRPKVGGLAGLAGQRRYLREEDLARAKAVIFWRHNIVGMAPVLTITDQSTGITVMGTWYRHTLDLPGEPQPFLAGTRSVMPWWKIEGSWPAGRDEMLAGTSLAAGRGIAVGDRVLVRGREFRVSGLVSTGGKEETMLIGELALVQELFQLPGKVSQVFVSALTTPMDEFAYKDPATMSQMEYEKWYCTGYVTSIAKQLEEVFAGSTAGPIWPVAEAEGEVLTRLEVLIGLLTALTLLASALGIAATMVMSLLRRTEEVALMKAIGADSRTTAMLFLAEAVVIGVAGGLGGFLLSLPLTDRIGSAVFGAALEQRSLLLPVCMVIAVLIAMLGAYLPVRRAMAIRPAVALKGAA